MLDLIITGGEIVDGSGDAPYSADIGIKGDTIKKIAPRIEERAKEILYAKGYVISPGFIDIHSHSDFTLLVNPKGESKLRQGVTTEVVGNCGFTPAPIISNRRKELFQYLVNTVVLTKEEKEVWNWESQSQFLNTIGEKGMAINIASLVGHGSLRVGILGFENRKPTVKELDKMINLLDRELQQGIWGMSTGLQYEPGTFAATEELVELGRVLAAYDGTYCTHLKSEGKYLMECIEEAIEIANRSNVSLQISHLKAENHRNWGKVKDALDRIDEARGEGTKVDFDVYPYIAFGSGLIDLIPPWVREMGSDMMVARLKEKEVRSKVIEEMIQVNPPWENPIAGQGWGSVRIATLGKEENKIYEGCSIEAIGAKKGILPQEAVIDLLIEEKGAIKAIYFGMCEEDLITIMKHPRAIFATDGRAVAPYGQLGKSKIHPRYYGTYPRILGRYVRQNNILSLEEAIMKSTMLPALKMGIKKRGLIKEDYFADIVIFDKDEIIDTASFEEPHQYPKGIPYVIVNGKIAISKGEDREVLAGKILDARN